MEEPMKSRKGVEGITWLIVVIAAMLIFLLLYGAVWGNLFRRGSTALGCQTGNTEDYDKDNVINIADKCPCQAGEGTVENNGCAPDYMIANTGQGKESRECLAKACDTINSGNK